MYILEIHEWTLIDDRNKGNFHERIQGFHTSYDPLQERSAQLVIPGDGKSPTRPYVCTFLTGSYIYIYNYPKTLVVA